MKFHATTLAGAHTLDIDRLEDSRGFFARVLCEKEQAAAGLEAHFVQINNSFSLKKGTLRGLHYQLPPAAEAKIVRCIRGAVWDVIVDLRPGSATFKKWFGAELTAENRTMMYAPRGFAHGLITLTDNTEAIYFISQHYAPQQERGLRWNDPAIGITWPMAPTEISPKDTNWPDLDAGFHGLEQLRGLT